MSKTYGVDVSSNNGSVNWNVLKNKYNVKCAMIRAGFGKGTEDTRVIENIKACKSLDIKFGLYWFSYALNKSEAIKEADLCCDYADKYGCEIGVAYDFEYDSERYAKSQGINITNSTRVTFATAFLERVKARGYYPILYTNLDYLLNKGLNQIRNKYKLWLAQWDVAKPEYSCDIWQYTVSNLGDLGNFDLNEFYSTDKDIKNDIKNYINNVQFSGYLKLAFDVINGKYGTGDNRREKIRAKGYDYEMVQELVNYIMESRTVLTGYFLTEQYNNYYKKALEIKDNYSTNTKKKLNAKGYDYEICREMAIKL